MYSTFIIVHTTVFCGNNRNMFEGTVWSGQTEGLIKGKGINCLFIGHTAIKNDYLYCIMVDLHVRPNLFSNVCLM